MKKALIILLVLSFVTACTTPIEPEEAVIEDAGPPIEESKEEDETADLTKVSAYFVELYGLKINCGERLSQVLDRGFTISIVNDMTSVIANGETNIPLLLDYGMNKNALMVYVTNDGRGSMMLEDCVISAVAAGKPGPLSNDINTDVRIDLANELSSKSDLIDIRNTLASSASTVTETGGFVRYDFYPVRTRESVDTTKGMAFIMKDEQINNIMVWFGHRTETDWTEETNHTPVVENIVDWSNKDLYFVNLYDYTIRCGSKLAEALEAGFVLSRAMKDTSGIPAGMVLSGLRFDFADERAAVILDVRNNQEEPVDLADCVIVSISVGDNGISKPLINTKVKTFGGIAIGNKMSNVMKLLGSPSKRTETGDATFYSYSDGNVNEENFENCVEFLVKNGIVVGLNLWLGADILDSVR